MPKTKASAAAAIPPVSPKRQAAAPARNGRGNEHATPTAARRPMKVSDVVALDIIRNIVAGGLQPGDRLPLESQMMEQHRVSRASLREALRLLEVQGLIHTRPGPNGGTVVGQVQVASLARTVTMHLHLLGATYDELLTAWTLTESTLAQLAANNPDRELVKRLMEPYLEFVEDDTHAISEGPRFHDLVGVLANNRILSFVLRIPSAIVSEHIFTNVRRELLEPSIVHDHARIAAAIISGNPQKAYWGMHEHVEDIVKLFRDSWPSAIGEKVEWR